MNASGVNKKRKRQLIAESEIEKVEDTELQAEIEAVLEMRAEKGNVEKTSKQPSAYNSAALLKSIEDMGTVNLPFIQTLRISDYTLGNIIDENDDLEREMMFYNHTLEAAMEGRRRLAELGIPVHRPEDFFCENVKTDLHMTKIKDRLLLEEKRIEAFELRKNRENNRKFNKQVSELRKQEKSKSRTTPNDQKEVKAGDYQDTKPIKSQKRVAMDRKYGSGVKAKMRSKLTDKKSLNDLSDFHPRGGKFVRREQRKDPGGRGRGSEGHSRRKKAEANVGKRRPGKEVRIKRRAGRNRGANEN